VNLGQLLDLIRSCEQLEGQLTEQTKWLSFYSSRGDIDKIIHQKIYVAKLESKLEQLRATEINEKR